MVNRLSEETSPYLQQHKNNPVDWFPYGEEAFVKAKDESKLIFISIGYSTCHWCHVMARESFQNKKTAEFMNKHFISIKVDREEYPGIDKAYQEMYTLLNQSGGGWPLSVYALPNGDPFYIGTYFPSESNYGIPSFMEVNNKIIDLWQNSRDLVIKQSESLKHGLKLINKHLLTETKELTNQIYQQELETLEERFDTVDGGIGQAPKFPRVSSLKFLLKEGIRQNKRKYIDFVQFTLQKMAQGGIYDQLGGGFSRYSVDKEWLIPHFEKMLYDNAGLIETLSLLYEITKDEFTKWIIIDTISWVAREMKSPDGGFYSAINAESEGREGTFYVWELKELHDILGENFEIAKIRYGITEKGNFEDPHHPEKIGMNVLSIKAPISEIAKILKLTTDEVVNKLNEIRKTLFEYRDNREKPSIDTKIISGWNALLIKALFVAGEAINYPKAGELAENALEFLITNLVTENHVLRSFQDVKSGQKKKEIKGVLDDYSFILSALITAFEFTDKWKYIETAKNICKLTINNFYNEDEKLFYLNPKSNEELFHGLIQATDDSMASGLSVMVSNLFKLGKYLEDDNLVDIGKKVLARFSGSMNLYPGAMDEMILSSYLYQFYPHEIVIVGGNDELNDSYHGIYLTNRLIYRWNENNKNDGRPFWEVLENRTDVKEPTVYICEGMTCSLPLKSREEVVKELKSN